MFAPPTGLLGEFVEQMWHVHPEVQHFRVPHLVQLAHLDTDPAWGGRGGVRWFGRGLVLRIQEVTREVTRLQVLVEEGYG